MTTLSFTLHIQSISSVYTPTKKGWRSWTFEMIISLCFVLQKKISHSLDGNYKAWKCSQILYDFFVIQFPMRFVCVSFERNSSSHSRDISFNFWIGYFIFLFEGENWNRKLLSYFISFSSSFSTLTPYNEMMIVFLVQRTFHDPQNAEMQCWVFQVYNLRWKKYAHACLGLAALSIFW